MSKELTEALIEYIASSQIVLASIADSHYLNGTSNKDFKQHLLWGNRLKEELLKETRKPAPIAPPPAPPVPAA